MGVVLTHPGITGHVTKTVTTTTLALPTIDNATQEQIKTEVKSSAMSWLKGLFTSNKDSKADASSPACCSLATDKVKELEDKVTDLQNQVKALQDRNSQSCQLQTITSGTCEAACK